MGTSASGGGAGSGNPLIPDFINGNGLPPAPPPTPPPPDDLDTDQDVNPDHDGEQPVNDENDASQEEINIPVDLGNRFLAPRKQFNRYVRSGGTNSDALKKALKNYSRHAAGTTMGLARRMQPAASRVASFYGVINTVKAKGKETALAEFNLSSYSDKPLIEILAAFVDVIFRDTGKIYEDTQDDSIAKQAYANTIVRIAEVEQIDLDALTNTHVEVMMAIFIEETIVQRVICDIGDKFTMTNTNIGELMQIEESIYQIVSGMVRTQIMPEIIAAQLGDNQRLEEKIENIYHLAFDAMSEINN